MYLYIFSLFFCIWQIDGNNTNTSYLCFFYYYLCDLQKDEEVEYFRNKFAGSQADRADRAVKEEAEAKKVTEKLKNTKISGDCYLFLPLPILVNCCCVCYILFHVFSCLFN